MKFKRTQFLTQGFKKYHMRVAAKNPKVPWKSRKTKVWLEGERYVEVE